MSENFNELPDKILFYKLEELSNKYSFFLNWQELHSEFAIIKQHRDKYEQLSNEVDDYDDDNYGIYQRYNDELDSLVRLRDSAYEDLEKASNSETFVKSYKNFINLKETIIEKEEKYKKEEFSKIDLINNYESDLQVIEDFFIDEVGIPYDPNNMNELKNFIKQQNDQYYTTSDKLKKVNNSLAVLASKRADIKNDIKVITKIDDLILSNVANKDSFVKKVQENPQPVTAMRK